MPVSSGSRRPASRACKGPARSAIHDASSAGSVHVAILGPPVDDGARSKHHRGRRAFFTPTSTREQKAHSIGFLRKCRYSRGGAYAVMLAQELFPRPIRFLGLIDPIRTFINDADPWEVSRNAPLAWQ